uniref:Uncharacterized protein n=1 Tax=Leersia perrieri TaxID=77586 RepID=A0A0D9UX35_9ORYZ
MQVAAAEIKGSDAAVVVVAADAHPAAAIRSVPARHDRKAAADVLVAENDRFSLISAVAWSEEHGIGRATLACSSRRRNSTIFCLKQLIVYRKRTSISSLLCLCDWATAMANGLLIGVSPFLDHLTD